MRRLDDIFDEYKRIILFEDGMWCIYRKNGNRCYIIHRCDKVNKAENPTNTTCHACSEAMPEALRGLFILNEWKR